LQTLDVSKKIFGLIASTWANDVAVKDEISTVSISDDEAEKVNTFLLNLYNVLKVHFIEKTYQEMKARHEQELEQLQLNCKHPRPQWIKRATAHMNGILVSFEIKLCGKCNKELGRRRYCATCEKQMENGSWKDGDGTAGRPIGVFFCDECWDEGKKIDEEAIKNRK